MEEKIVKMADGFEFHIVNPDKETKPVTEKDVFGKLLDFAEKKAKEIEKRNKEKSKLLLNIVEETEKL